MRFSEKICNGLSRPDFKLVSQMIYGILGSQSCHLSKIARTLDETISLKKTIDRLSRNLSDFNEGGRLFENYIRRIKGSISTKTILIVDDSDITKPCSAALEGLCRIRDGSTGEIINVYLFVATLPYSQYTYVEPCLDMKQDTWLRCHVNMYEFFQGVTIRTACDNLKTGVISHPREGDIILNSNYEALGSHYMTAIMPTGVKKPKHKPSVEGNVGGIASAIIAKLRNQTFFSFNALKSAVREKLDGYNREDFRKREGSRKLVFEEEKLYMNPLPAIPYEIAEWVYG